MRVVYPSLSIAKDDARVRSFYQRLIAGVHQLPCRECTAVFLSPLGGGCWGAVFSAKGSRRFRRAQVPVRVST